MEERDWHNCHDASLMLEYYWSIRDGSSSRLPRIGGDIREQHSGSTQLHQFYLACCRRIWPLLPQKESRQGVELAEQWIAGNATDEEVNRFNYFVEGAAFNIDYNCVPEKISRWAAELVAADFHRTLLQTPESADEIGARELLKRAAYFADYAMIYPSLRPLGLPPESYWPFLSADLLREHVTFDEVIRIF